MLKNTRATDPVLANLVDEELKRQEHNIEMIASESTAPLAVMELTGSVFTNKTLEGYPGRRFQAGSHVADEVEKLGCERAKELFGAEHANIQSYSGSTANYSVFASVLKPGDRVLSMRLDQGGHLTHGSPANWVSKIYNFDFYAMDPETELIDYDALDAKAKEYQPKLIIAGASSYSRLIDYHRKNSKRRWRILHGRYGSYRRTCCSKSYPKPDPVCRFCNFFYNKNFLQCTKRNGIL